MTLRRKTYDILKISDKRGTVSHRFDMLLIVIILLNAPVLIFDSVESIHRPFATFFLYSDRFSIAFFTLEYLLRVWNITESPRHRYPGQAILHRGADTGVCPYMKRRRGRPALIIQTHVSACCIAGEIIG